MLRNKKGFTLIEMLVVIAIIAVLVSIVIPTVSSATTKAEAAVDAANLRNVLGYMNSVLMTEQMSIDEAIGAYTAPECKSISGTELHILYTVPGVIDVYYTDGTNYYGLDYFSDLAEGAEANTLNTTKPATAGTWYKAGSSIPLN